jgi:hypothetical protein
VSAGNHEDGYYLQEEGLIYMNKLCVTYSELTGICEHFHAFGHPGILKLSSIVFARCLFECNKTKVIDTCAAVCKACHVCQAVKPASGPRQPGTMDFWPIPADVFHSLAMDFLSLPETKLNGATYDSCLIVVCRLSGYIQAIPCAKKGLTAEKVADLFLRHCVCLTGIPLEILSDNDNLITSEFFE